MSTLIDRIKPGLEQIGINICGIARGADWQPILPGCRSVLVFASGGPGLWQSFLSHLRADPRRLTAEEHPLDTYIAGTLEVLDPDPPRSRRWIRCGAGETGFVDFRLLGRQAGLGWQSRLGLLLHPEYGPWMALRLACFTTEDMTPAQPLPGTGPCGDCPAPCVGACPSGAVSPSAPWDVNACAGFHVSSTVCERTCHAREACPVGIRHSYPVLARHYHSDRRTGRIALGNHLDIEPGAAGSGPEWSDWSSG